MPAKTITPSLGADSFSCPTCGAISHQTWYRLYATRYDNDSKPTTPHADALDRIRKDPDWSPEQKVELIEFFTKVLSRVPFIEKAEHSAYLNLRFENCYVSQCYSCDAFSIWLFDSLLFPITNIEIEPNADMPAGIQLDFQEAARIVDLSPRGAAALLRLAIQKLIVQLGEKGKDLNGDIANLVRRGLDPQIQRALDIVRVIGNEAVHPGQIDLRDDKATATQLFDLVNLIADTMISRPKRIAEMYDRIPVSKREAIERRDSAKNDLGVGDNRANKPESGAE